MTPDMPQAHLSHATINALIDDELDTLEAQAAQQHLAACHACALAVIAAAQLKTATARTGKRFVAAPDALARLAGQLQPEVRPARVLAFPAAGWMALAAAIVLFAVLIGWQRQHAANALSAELLDQHLATLSDGAAPEVISSDRHTVKPWFQGKLPFSFNLPEPAALPPDTTLEGADFAFVDGQPAAQLLFTIHKHHASVFLTERVTGGAFGVRSTRAGFNLRSATTAELRLNAVSDVNATELEALLEALVRVQ